MSEFPLSDLRLLDLSRARAGPTCVKFLGAFGADVIKIKIDRRDGGSDQLRRRLSGNY